MSCHVSRQCVILTPGQRISINFSSVAPCSIGKGLLPGDLHLWLAEIVRGAEGAVTAPYYGTLLSKRSFLAKYISKSTLNSLKIDDRIADFYRSIYVRTNVSPP